ncbi:MAG: peptidylprolyl isomerase [Proteobacteria bacterium]|nr:MAG: peptidylprolyl isomerase [Pseudomonadota bacterium]
MATGLVLTLAVGCGKDSKADAGTPSETPAADAAADKAGDKATDGKEAGSGAAKPAAGAAKVSAADAKPAAAAPSDALKDPSKATETAPADFKVKFVTTKGDVILGVHRDWAPKGVDRFYNMVKAGFYTDIAFFRVIGGFMAQFGIHGDPAIARAWREARIDDDPVKQSNKRGRVTFATAGPNTRTTQVFINFGDNVRLDGMGFAPFAEVVEGMDVVDALYSGYGEGAPRGKGPHQGRVQSEGNAYLKKDFPKMDYIKSAELLPTK